MDRESEGIQAPGASGLAAWLRANREHVLRAWTRLAGRSAAAQRAGIARVLDALPHALDAPSASDRDARLEAFAALRTVLDRLIGNQRARVSLDELVALERALDAELLALAAESVHDRAQARFRALAQGSAELVWLTDGRGRPLADNPGLRAFTGLSARTLARADGWLAAVHPADRTRVAGRVSSAVAEGHEVEDEYRVRRHDGDYRDVHVRSVPVRDREGRVVEWLNLGSDVTHARRAQRFRERLIAVVGHDLRNPLQAILLSAQQLVSRPDLPEAARGAARRAARSAERIGEIVNVLFDFTRVRLGEGIPIERRPVDLCEVAARVVEEFEATHPGRVKGRFLDGHGKGQWDPHRVAQALGNLISNALDHGEPDQPVEVRVCDDRGGCRLEVENRGGPIPAEAARHLFDPFRRAAGKSRGLGLGLYIVEQIARAHGGKASIASEGNRVVAALWLPRGDVPVGEPGAPA
ncbi:MAG: PAS domain-containing sensor histidine kinase [Deltaproteobacteria bacterium]|nr:PAS domain-containing sensor histidine kinase [Deltaproteobacteria bacterium]